MPSLGLRARVLVPDCVAACGALRARACVFVCVCACMRAQAGPSAAGCPVGCLPSCRHAVRVRGRGGEREEWLQTDGVLLLDKPNRTRPTVASGVRLDVSPLRDALSCAARVFRVVI